MYQLGKKLNLDELRLILGEDKKADDYSIKRIIFDSRIAQRGDLFIPLKGQKYNGENFVNSVIEKNAAVLTSQNISNQSIQVPNVYEALLKLCRYKISVLKPKTIFITGSYGKTTIKNMLMTALGSSCHVSNENENNEFGIPFTILSMPETTEYLVVECGARKQGDFDLISKFLYCDIFILTSIANNHLKTFGSVENIINTKLKLRECLIESSNFIDGRLITKEKILETNKEIVKQTLSFLSIEKNLDQIEFSPTAGRGNRINKFGGQIIDQTYNAHPDTTLATAMEEDSEETILILGDMAELGDDEKNIHATLLNQLDDYQIYFTGKIFESLKENIKNQKHIFFKGKQDFPVDYLAKQLKVGKKIYFKGSRSSKMEIYLNMLLND